MAPMKDEQRVTDNRADLPAWASSAGDCSSLMCLDSDRQPGRDLLARSGFGELRRAPAYAAMIGAAAVLARYNSHSADGGSAPPAQGGTSSTRAILFPSAANHSQTHGGSFARLSRSSRAPAYVRVAAEQGSQKRSDRWLRRFPACPSRKR